MSGNKTVVNLTLLVPLFYLLSIGIIILNSLSVTSLAVVKFSFETQLIAIAIGLLLFWFALRSTYQFWAKMSWWIYVLAIVSLGVVLLSGQTYNGAQRWLGIGVLQFQPTELAKFAIIALLARLFTKRAAEMNKLSTLLLSAAYVVVPALLIILEPDLGSVVLILIVWLSMLFASTIRKSTVMLMIAIILLAVPISYPFLADYQKQRIDTFFNPSLSVSGEGYNVMQATIAVGSGGWLGKGLDSGSQSTLSFIPSQHTDFIFSVIAEKLGFVGAFSVILAMGVLLIRLIFLAWSASQPYVRYFGVGVVSMLLAQFTINIAMNLGLFPVTGLPLPLISYGGTHIVISLLMIGALVGMLKSKSHQTFTS